MAAADQDAGPTFTPTYRGIVPDVAD